MSFLLLLCTLFQAARADSQFLGSLNDLENLLKQVDAKELYHDREWLILGHYKKHPKYWKDYLSEVDGPEFFFSNEGKDNPQAELKATLKAFFEPLNWYKEERLHPQCRFPARRGWLVEKLGITPTQLKLLPCTFQVEWKKKLDADRVSVIFAASYMNNPASMFGHTFIKFHTRGVSDENDLLNYGLNFAATTGNDGGFAFMYKGMLGGYKGEFSFTPYYLKLLTYSNVEGRDIWVYNLNLSEHEVNRMIDHLLELEQTYFDYYFFSENCSYQILSLLEWARPSLHLQDYFFYEVIPADTIVLLAQQKDLVSKVSYRPALRQSLEARLRKLNKNERKIAQEFFEDKDLDNLLQKIKNLEPRRRANTIDAALAFGAIQEIKHREEWKDILFKLQSERAKLGIQAENIDVQSNQGPPHESHPPARLSVGPGYQKGDHGFLNVGFRFSYHELTDSDVGLLTGAQIQFMSFQTRYNFEREVLDITRARLFDLISLSPWGLYSKPFSWKAALGYENTFSEDMAHLAGGAGATFDLSGGKRLLLGVFADAEVDRNPDLSHQHFFGAGGSSILRWQVSDQIRLLLQARGLWDTAAARWQADTQANAAYNWNKENQVELQFKSKSDERINASEVMLLYERYFLL